MSSEILREAAALMRSRAEAATPGPWETYFNIHAEAAACEVGRGGFGTVALPATGRPDYGRANIEHIAGMHPAVALAVADWLDVTAADLDENSLLDSPESGDYQPANPEALWCEYCGGAIESPDYPADDQRCKCERWSRALAVARTHLGRDA